MKDGLVLFYIKNDTLYPVMLTQEQVDTFEIIQGLIPQPIRVVWDKPQGKIENIIPNKN
jgi:hypothetical protein